MSYYDTTHLEGDELADSRRTAGKQDDIILACFARFPRGATPSDVHGRVLQNAPITSVRRSITTLTNRGLLVKTDEKRTGPFGKPEYVWTRPPVEPVQQELF